MPHSVDNGSMSDSSSRMPRFLAPSEVAELLSIDVDEVIALVHEGRLRGSQLGSPPRWRVEESSLGEYLDEQSEQARRIALWHQANEASFPEVWGTAPRQP
jgi:excisionase family DNA binding protein